MSHILTVSTLIFAACGGTSAAHTSARQTADSVPVIVDMDHTRRDSVPAQDWPRFGWDVGRSSAMTAPTGINATNVGSMRRQRVAIDGTVDASAIYLHGAHVNGGVHDAFFVTTTYGKTLAIDADNGKVLWQYTPPGYDSWSGSRQITTATPVADGSRAYIYAASPDGHVQKLAVSNGRAEWSSAITTLPKREKIASSLNYFRGNVIAVTGGYIGDAAPYQGHIAIIDGATGKVLQVWNSLCSDNHALMNPASCPESGSAIWGRAGAVIDSGSGNIFVATGNGAWDGRRYWGDATLELHASATRLIGNYTPVNNAHLNDTDADVGSTSPVLLGNGYVAQGGKDGTIRLLDARVLQGDTPHKGGELQVVQTPGSARLFSAPAVLHGRSSTLMFVADASGTAAWSLSSGRLQPVWQNGNGGTSPVIAGGLLYVYDPRGGVRVYQPETGKQVGNLESGGGHWNSPIVVDGRIALPEGNSNDHDTRGVLDIWRLP